MSFSRWLWVCGSQRVKSNSNTVHWNKFAKFQSLQTEICSLLPCSTKLKTWLPKTMGFFLCLFHPPCPCNISQSMREQERMGLSILFPKDRVKIKLVYQHLVLCISNFHVFFWITLEHFYRWILPLTWSLFLMKIPSVLSCLVLLWERDTFPFLDLLSSIPQYFSFHWEKKSCYLLTCCSQPDLPRPASLSLAKVFSLKCMDL